MADLNKPIIDKFVYDPKEPFFWNDVVAKAPLFQEMMANWEQIRDEVAEFLKDGSALFNYPKYTVHYNDQTYPLYAHYWKAVPMSIFEKEYIDGGANPFQLEMLYKIIRNAKAKCPTIQKIIAPLEAEGILRNCFISRLIPGSHIRPHDGTSPHFMRVHLGLVCDPACQITVGKETQTWHEGKVLAFKDGGPHLHEVKHLGTQERIILSCDIRMDPYLLPYMNEYHEHILSTP